MIEIVYDRMRLRLTADGHAGFAEAGQDIVCAAVTILVYTLAAAVGNMDAAGQAIEAGVKLLAISVLMYALAFVLFKKEEGSDRVAAH